MEGDGYVVLLALLEGEIDQNEYMYLNNIELRYVSLPSYIYGLIYKHKDVFLVAINKSLSETKKKKTILHELAHFELKHWDKEVFEYKIEGLEDEADRYVDFLLNKE